MLTRRHYHASGGKRIMPVSAIPDKFNLQSVFPGYPFSMLAKFFA
jgi:hypothetical protein